MLVYYGILSTLTFKPKTFSCDDPYLMGWRSNMGGCVSASSMAVMPTAQISHCWLYPPFFSTAATSGAIQYGVPMNDFLFISRVWVSWAAIPKSAAETE